MAFLRPPTKMRPVRQQSRTFYLTALMFTLFACYSVLRDFHHGDSHRAQALAVRSLEGRDLECRFVHDAVDKCAFVKENCPDEEAGMISYLQFYYCSPLSAVKPVAFTILVLWISLLFSTIGIAASDFLCINLSTIATVLGMSESLTGVTFLAFGNGSPDVFSTFAAMRSNSGSLAVGELVGAAGFITAVVAGSMALVEPFQVAKKSFVRDVAFFAVAASFSLVFLADGSLRLWECVAMIIFYLAYVLFVVMWHWWLTRRRRVRLAETTARLHHHIPDTQELIVPEIEEDEESRPASERSRLLRGPSSDSIPTLRTPATPAWRFDDLDEDEETRDRYLAELQSQMRVSRAVRGERRNTLTPIRPSLIGALEFRSVMTALERKAANTQPIGLRRYSDDASNPTTPAPRSAPLGPYHPGQLGEPYRDEDGYIHAGRIRAVSALEPTHLSLDTTFEEEGPAGDRNNESAVISGESTPVPSTRPSRPSAGYLRTLNEPASQKPPSPGLGPATPGSQGTGSLTSEPAKSPGLLAPPSTNFRRPNYQENRRGDDLRSPGALSPLSEGPGSRSPIYPSHSGPNLEVPILHMPHPGHSRGALRYPDFPPFADSPRDPSPSSSRAPSIHLPEPTMSPGSSHHLALLPGEGEEEQMRVFSWWPYHTLPAPQVIIATLFPTIYGWREKSTLERVLGLVTAPSVFLLTITLPVVEPPEDMVHEADLPLQTPAGGWRERSESRVVLGPGGIPLSPKALFGTDDRSDPHANGVAKSLDAPVGEGVGAKEWNRWLVFVQVFTAPIFVVTIGWTSLDDDLNVRLYIRLVLGSLVFSLVSLLLILSLTTPTREPKYRPLFCFLGFAVAIGWISSIANEVVGVLKAFGVILGISDAILGLTIFAVGNSCGDLVANITVAKLGYPVMALSACFGGPMLNILLGIGIGGMYMTMHNASHKHAKHPQRPIKYKPYEIEVSTTLMVSGITLVVTLVALLIVVPLNGWKMDRRIGIGLILVWLLSTTGNVIMEIVGVGGDSIL